MSYGAPSPIAVDRVLASGYTPPAATVVNRTLIRVGSSYGAPSAIAVDRVLESGYTPPAATVINRTLIRVVSVPPAENNTIRVGFLSAWTLSGTRKNTLLSVYSQAPDNRTSKSVPHTVSLNASITKVNAWSNSDLVSRTATYPYRLVAQLSRQSMGIWAYQPTLAAGTLAAWFVEAYATRLGVSSGWLAPPQKCIAAKAMWGVTAQKRRLTTCDWINLQDIKRIEAKAPWGLGRYPSWLVVPPPPVVIHPPIPPKQGHRVGFNLKCPINNNPGNRTPLRLGSIGCGVGLTPGTIIVMNNAYMKRLPDNVNIDVFGMIITANVDEFCWTLSAEVSHAALGLVSPNIDGPITVEVGVNGYVWRFIVEDFSEGEQRQDKSHVRTLAIGGRSVTALLGANYAFERSKVNNAVRTSQQLINDELTYLAGYSCDYDTVAWTVPAGAFAYENATPIDVARLVANASGAVLLSHPYDATLSVKPRYPHSPWDWLVSAVDKQLLASVVVNLSGQVGNKPLHNAVIVQGDQQGVTVNAKRTGSAGDAYATQIVDPLILTVPVGTERARNVLSDRGNQTAYALRLPLFATPLSTGQPGLFNLLDLTQYIDGMRSWLAQCTSVQIEVNRSDRALVVWQTITLERHLTDAN